VGSTEKQEIYCVWERKRFPAAQFDEVSGQGLVHVRDVSEPHTASGLPLMEPDAPDAGSGWNAPADVPPDS